MQISEVLEKIRDCVGERGVVDDPIAGQAYLQDERGLYEGEAALIVRPDSVEAVSQVMKICHEVGLGVVPQGGNTGYCGGATPTSATDQIVLSLSRLNKVRELDAVGFTMTLDAGVVLANAQTTAADAGLLFPLSMGSEGSCQIGGNLSTNAGGLAVLRYGTARELVLGLEVVLPDGRIVNGLTGLRKDNTGLDLKSLFMGAEGSLGVITGAVLKLFPAPRSVETAWLAVASPDAACRLLGLARQQSGDAVTSFEYISKNALDLVLRHIEGVSNPLDTGGEHFVLMELSSGDTGSVLRDTLELVLTSGMEAGLIDDGVLAESGQQRTALWRLRECIPEAEKHVGGSVKHDISVQISKIPQYIDAAPARLPADAAPYLSVYGHIGDGNLHYNLLPSNGDDADLWRKQWSKTLSREIHALAAEMDGSFSAEHGIGQLKRDDLEAFKDPAALQVMRSIKSVIDTRGIMNPGKVL